MGALERESRGQERFSPCHDMRKGCTKEHPGSKPRQPNGQQENGTLCLKTEGTEFCQQPVQMWKRMPNQMSSQPCWTPSFQLVRPWAVNLANLCQSLDPWKLWYNKLVLLKAENREGPALLCWGVGGRWWQQGVWAGSWFFFLLEAKSPTPAAHCHPLPPTLHYRTSERHVIKKVYYWVQGCELE